MEGLRNMADEPEVEVTVTGSDNNDAAEVATATTAAEATVAAGEAEENAEQADEAAVEAWLSAEQAWNAEQSAYESANRAEATAMYTTEQLAELSTVAANLVEAARLQAANQATTQQPVVLDDPATAVDESIEEEPPQTQHWLTKQWFGKKK